MTKGQKNPPQDEEKTLLECCRSGDSSCWQELYERYRLDAWRILYKILGPNDELEDLVQKVFMKVYRSLGSFEGRSKFSTWLYRICVHVAMDDIRRRKRRREHVNTDSLEELEALQASPMEALEHKEAAARLNDALSRLKEQKRTVLVLHDIMEVSAEEIASSLGIPAATVRTRLFYGRRELARHLANQGSRRKR